MKILEQVCTDVSSTLYWDFTAVLIYTLIEDDFFSCFLRPGPDGGGLPVHLLRPHQDKPALVLRLWEDGGDHTPGDVKPAGDRHGTG